MTIEHHLCVAATRCSSLLQRYHDGQRSTAMQERMAAEVEVIIGWLMELGLPLGATQHGLLKPVELWLLERYGPEVGPRINGEFVEAFERAGMPLLTKANYYFIKEFKAIA